MIILDQMQHIVAAFAGLRLMYGGFVGEGIEWPFAYASFLAFLAVTAEKVLGKYTGANTVDKAVPGMAIRTALSSLSSLFMHRLTTSTSATKTKLHIAIRVNLAAYFQRRLFFSWSSLVLSSSCLVFSAVCLASSLSLSRSCRPAFLTAGR